MLLSVIIPAFNEEQLLGRTLKQIQFALEQNQDKGFSWEIIVCDNNSSDRTAEVASQMGATVTFEPINQISRARNTGAAEAHGEWLLFIDADSFPCPALIAEIVNIVESGNYVGCGTTVLVEEGTLFNKLRIERLNPLFRLFSFCGGVFILCNRDAFKAIGGFSIKLYAYEELDFVIRLKRYGRRHGKKFTILHRHPVITSGRKAEYDLSSIAVLFISNILSLVFLCLYWALPTRLLTKLGPIALAYWYKARR